MCVLSNKVELIQQYLKSFHVMKQRFVKTLAVFSYVLFFGSFLQLGCTSKMLIKMQLSHLCIIFCRFPDDIYDRIWLSWSVDGGIAISTASPVDPNNHPLMPPSAVMQTAQTSATLGPETYLSSILSGLSGSTDLDSDLNLFFAEIGTNSSATSRGFNISLSGNMPVVTENPYVDAGGALKADIKSFTDWSIGMDSTVTLTPLPTATNPPLLNALELLVPITLSTSTTAAADGK